MAMNDTPRIYTVGTGSDDDFTPDQIELLTMQIRDWFISDECDRNYADPYKEAKDKIEQCLQATNAKRQPWLRTIPKTFESRIKVKTLFDMEDGEHISQDRAKTPAARANQSHGQSLKDKATKVTSAKVTKYQDDVEQDILQAYPELDNPVHRPNVVRLAMLYAEQERIRIEMPGAQAGVRIKKIETLALLERTIKDCMKALDIFPDQIRKRMDKNREGSVGDLVALIDEDLDFKAREKRWAQVLALQLWWMTKHPNGKKTGPQIHDFEMWHLTRTRTMHYTCKCGVEVQLVEGFTPDELLEYLAQEGVLIEKPILPQLYTEEDLDGLAVYDGSSEPALDDNEAMESPDDTGDAVSEGI